MYAFLINEKYNNIRRKVINFEKFQRKFIKTSHYYSKRVNSGLRRYMQCHKSTKMCYVCVTTKKNVRVLETIRNVLSELISAGITVDNSVQTQTKIFVAPYVVIRGVRVLDVRWRILCIFGCIDARGRLV